MKYTKTIWEIIVDIVDFTLLIVGFLMTIFLSFVLGAASGMALGIIIVVLILGPFGLITMINPAILIFSLGMIIGFIAVIYGIFTFGNETTKVKVKFSSHEDNFEGGDDGNGGGNGGG